MHVREKQLWRFVRFTKDIAVAEYIQCTCAFSDNCLKASADKTKQQNWNKNNKININLESTTIFLGKKKTLHGCVSIQ